MHICKAADLASKKALRLSGYGQAAKTKGVQLLCCSLDNNKDNRSGTQEPREGNVEGPRLACSFDL
ncbi:hypothetical protein OMCYN_01612 [cyanobiont of Ornithocercus magnificus]|nr:hypothetical protein OMCYN_01612 [cyanobiont of Ornithocercus magnificus]